MFGHFVYFKLKRNQTKISVLGALVERGWGFKATSGATLVVIWRGSAVGLCCRGHLALTGEELTRSSHV